MFWRYLTLTLLLGVPSSRILSFAAFQNPPDRQSLPSNEDQLVDKIVKQLTTQQKEEAAGLGQQSGSQQTIQNEQRVFDGLGQNGNSEISKKDEAKESSSEGVNFKEKEPSDKPDSSKKESTKDSTGGGDKDASEVQGVVYAAPGRYEAHRRHRDDEETSHFLSTGDTTFAVFVGVGVAAGFVGLMMAGICYYKFRKNAKAASDVEYPAYGVTGPMKEKIPSPGDRKLAQSAQMYHYQHQKQQMIAMEKANGDMKHDASDDDSEEDNVEGDYTVFECPGLAPTGEMEVINPLFRGGEENPANTETPSAPPDPVHGNQ